MNSPQPITLCVWSHIDIWISIYLSFIAALPEPPNNCEIENELLHCEPGHDGGLPQRFLLEVLEVRHRSEPSENNEISTMNDQVSVAEAVLNVTCINLISPCQ